MNYKSFIVWSALIAFYLITRLINLKIIPIFTDEAIYSYWAQVALHDPANRFISLEDGKQPLFIWMAAFLQKFIADPLTAGRIVSVLSGFASALGIYLLCKSLFTTLAHGLREKVAVTSSFLYILLPFTLLYDRMALFDSLLTSLCIYAVLLSIKLARSLRLDHSILNGIAIGLAMITKSSGALFLFFLPFSLLLFDFKRGSNRKNLFKWSLLAAVSFIFAQTIYNSLRLSPLFYIIARKNLEFIRPTSEVISDPFKYFFSNFSAIISWVIGYIGLPLFLLFLLSVTYGFTKKNREIIYLSLLVIAPFLAEALFNKVLYPRFVLFYFPFLIVLISYMTIMILERFNAQSLLLKIIFILFLTGPSITSYHLLTNPSSAQIPQSDSGQYLNDWPAGYGVEEVKEFIKIQSNNQKVYVATEGTFGLLPFALQIYFYNQKNVEIYGFWPIDSNDLPAQILDFAKIGKTYLVFNENQKEITNKHLKFVDKYQKGRGQSVMRLYEVNP